MDTVTHFIIGISLAGLSQIDPIVAHDSTVAPAIIIGTIIGSQAPDFDGVSKLFGGTASYIEHHRGITHSIPSIFFWASFISFLISSFYPSFPFLHLWIWTFISVLVHILLDLLNTYGTQFLRPYSKKWISFNIINIFDPFIFTIHFVSIVIWILFREEFISLFIIVYLSTIFYCLIRALLHNKIKKILETKYRLKGSISIFPTIRWNTWNIVEELPNQFNLGIITNYKLSWIENKKKYNKHESIEISKFDKKIKNFLYFSKYAYAEWKKTPQGFDVIWMDLRYRFCHNLTLMILVTLDEKFNTIGSIVIWKYYVNHYKEKLHLLLKHKF